MLDLRFKATLYTASVNKAWFRRRLPSHQKIQVWKILASLFSNRSLETAIMFQQKVNITVNISVPTAEYSWTKKMSDLLDTPLNLLSFSMVRSSQFLTLSLYMPVENPTHQYPHLSNQNNINTLISHRFGSDSDKQKTSKGPETHMWYWVFDR